MKCILNESPVKTTNGFRINNTKVDLDLPKEYNSHDYEIENIDVISKIKNNFKSAIGLEHETYKNIELDITDSDDKLIKIRYNFNGNDNLVDNIDINVRKNISSSILVIYKTQDLLNHFHNGNINISAESGSSLNVTILCEFNEESINFLSGNIKCHESSSVTINLIDLSGKVRIYNFKSNTNKLSTSKLNNIYVGKNNSLIDLNYYYSNLEESSCNNIEVQGILDGTSTKTFRGVIDFIKGAKKSVGYENENCLLLSDTSISKSLPIILCFEEEVVGTHSASSGKIDDNKLFYLMSRGIDEIEAKRLIIKSNFIKIINQIPSEFQEEISCKIDKII